MSEEAEAARYYESLGVATGLNPKQEGLNINDDYELRDLASEFGIPFNFQNPDPVATDG